MIVLDTNVISALMDPARNSAVVAWMNLQPDLSVWTTSITILELRFGIERLGSKPNQSLELTRGS
ncbi:VapC toxin family PIN domain ribonuclease (fragment) [Beijerinckiaceae bacterium RH AL1]